MTDKTLPVPAIRVQIERRKVTATERVIAPILQFAFVIVLFGYLAMLLFPPALHWHPGYGQCLAIAGLVRVLYPSSTKWLEWTHPAPKRAKR